MGEIIRIVPWIETDCSFCRLQHKAETPELSLMFDAAGDEIDARGLDRGMAEDIGESHDVVAAGVECCGKEMTQVMREHFAWCDAGNDGESFHFGPDLSTRQAFSARGEKNLAVGNFFVLRSISEVCGKGALAEG